MAETERERERCPAAPDDDISVWIPAASLSRDYFVINGNYSRKESEGGVGAEKQGSA